MKTLLQKKGLGCLFLFTLPFLLGGGVALYLGLSSVWQWHAAKSWVERPARLLSIELVEQDSDDSVVYSLKAHYEYEHYGKLYDGDRVGIETGSDSNRDYHIELLHRLQAESQDQGFVRCWVNPKHPTRALLDRNLRLGLLGLWLVFGLIFGGAGAGLLVAGLVGHKIQEKEQELERLYPNEPWRHRKQWSGGRIKQSRISTYLFPALFATFWLLISAPIPFLVYKAWQDGEKIALVGLLLPLVGLGLAVWAIKSYWRAKKFGANTVQLTPFPGRIGGTVAGRMNLEHSLEATSLHWTLSCVRRQRSRGKNRGSSESILWQDTYAAQRQSFEVGARGSVIPFEFAVPLEAEPSTISGLPSRILWRLSAEAEVPGVNFKAQFDVPVFRTAESSATNAALAQERVEAVQNQGRSPEEAESATQSLLTQSGIRLEPLPHGGWSFVAGPARSPGLTGFAAVFSLPWLGFGAFLFTSGKELLLAFVFSLIGLGALCAVAELLLGNTRVEVSSASLSVVHRWLGKGRHRQWTSDQVSGLRAERGWSMGNKLFYQVRVDTLDGKSHVVFKRLGSLRTARHLIAKIEEELDLQKK